jgi:hypothetical protein
LTEEETENCSGQRTLRFPFRESAIRNFASKEEQICFQGASYILGSKETSKGALCSQKEHVCFSTLSLEKRLVKHVLVVGRLKC